MVVQKRLPEIVGGGTVAGNYRWGQMQIHSSSIGTACAISAAGCTSHDSKNTVRVDGSLAAMTAFSQSAECACRGRRSWWSFLPAGVGLIAVTRIKAVFCRKLRRISSSESFALYSSVQFKIILRDVKLCSHLANITPSKLPASISLFHNVFSIPPPERICEFC